MWYNQNNPDLSGVSTMVQFRNLPAKNVIGSQVYIGTLGTRVMNTQINTTYAIYPRPNIKSSEFSDASSPGYVTFFAVGTD